MRAREVFPMDIKKILYPVDLTGFSFRIVQQVISLAEKHGAEIHLITVVDANEGFGSFYVPHPSLDLFESQDYERAHRKLCEFELEHLANVRNVTRRVLEGRRTDQILKYIDSAGIDLVIMASHRRSGLEKALLGSVADEVIKRSPVPVMTINPAEREKGWQVSNALQARDMDLRLH
jgi:nucleotide-binding universal stress UspA family protein